LLLFSTAGPQNHESDIVVLKLVSIPLTVAAPAGVYFDKFGEAARPATAHGSRPIFVHRLPQSLFAPQVTLRGFHRLVAEQELDLLHDSGRCPATQGRQ
jgi:hypothetical protein